MSIIQTFYNNLATQYDKLFLDWQATTREQVEIRILSDTFAEKFDIVIAMDNALPHMLSSNDLEKAIKSIANQIKRNGIFVASIRDYDSLLMEKPPYSPPYIHKTDKGQRVSFQTWVWKDDNYKLTQYIVDDEETLQVSKFECEYRCPTAHCERYKPHFDFGDIPSPIVPHRNKPQTQGGMTAH